MNIKHLRIFKAVCDNQSVSKAAKSLYLAQPAVSLAIKELEQYYQVKLFDRINRRLILTVKGQELLNYANMILEMFDDIDAKIRNQTYGGKLYLGCSVTFANYFLNDVIKQLKKSYPELDLKVMVTSSLKVEEAVRENQVDLGIIEGIKHFDNLVATKIYQDELVFVGNHQQKSQLSFKEFNQQNFLLRNIGSAHREIFDGIVKSNNLNANILMESIDTNVIINACINGLGIAFLPYKFVASYLDKDLHIISIKSLKAIQRAYFLIHHQQKYLTPAMQLCQDYLIQHQF